jgi:hypothetical protein
MVKYRPQSLIQRLIDPEKTANMVVYLRLAPRLRHHRRRPARRRRLRRRSSPEPQAMVSPPTTTTRAGGRAVRRGGAGCRPAVGLAGPPTRDSVSLGRRPRISAALGEGGRALAGSPPPGPRRCFGSLRPSLLCPARAAAPNQPGLGRPHGPKSRNPAPAAATTVAEHPGGPRPSPNVTRPDHEERAVTCRSATARPHRLPPRRAGSRHSHVALRSRDSRAGRPERAPPRR